MAPKRTAGGKLLLLGPVQLGVTYSAIYMCFPVLGSSYMPEPYLHASMRVHHQSGRQGSTVGMVEAGGCQQQQWGHNRATYLQGHVPRPYDIQMQHVRTWVCQQCPHRAAHTWRCEIVVVEAAEEHKLEEG